MSNDTSAKRNNQKLQRLIVDALEGVKGQDIQVFNTETLSPLFERVIVASGTSNRQTRALAMAVRDAVKEGGFVKPRLEGEDNGEWIIVDCGQAVVHIMQPVIRQYYRLEELWGETPVRLARAGSKRVTTHAQSFAREVAAVETAAKASKAPAKKASTKPAAKVAAKTPAKTPAKLATKAPAKAAAKPVAKVPAKSAAKVATKTTSKSATKSTTKPATKVVAKAPAKSVTRSTAVKKIVVKAKAAPAKKMAVKRASKSPVSPKARNA